jgi:HlyD family secretion protein
LHKQTSISDKIYDEAKTKYHSAISQRDLAKASYDLAKINLEDAAIRFPTDGFIVARNIEIGEVAAVGTPVFSIMPDKKTKARTYANSGVLTRINMGDSVTVHTAANSFQGHVAFISPESEFTPKNIETKELRISLVSTVRIIVDNEADELKQGMRVTIVFDSKNDQK